MTPEHVKSRVARALVIKEWLDNRITEVFTDYCNTFGIHRAYGVESYDIGAWGSDDLRIVQDITRRGCYDTTVHNMPTEYLYLDHEPRLALMASDKARKDALDADRNKATKRAELARAAADVARLSRELSE